MDPGRMVLPAPWTRAAGTSILGRDTDSHPERSTGAPFRHLNARPGAAARHSPGRTGGKSDGRRIRPGLLSRTFRADGRRTHSAKPLRRCGRGGPGGQRLRVRRAIRSGLTPHHHHVTSRGTGRTPSPMPHRRPRQNARSARPSFPAILRPRHAGRRCPQGTEPEDMPEPCRDATARVVLRRPRTVILVISRSDGRRPCHDGASVPTRRARCRGRWIGDRCQLDTPPRRSWSRSGAIAPWWRR